MAAGNNLMRMGSQSSLVMAESVSCKLQIKIIYDQEKLKYDIYYNIEEGIEILNSMYDRNDLPKIKGAGREVIENWYFPVMAYNGTKPVNSPLYSAYCKEK